MCNEKQSKKVVQMQKSDVQIFRHFLLFAKEINLMQKNEEVAQLYKSEVEIFAHLNICISKAKTFILENKLKSDAASEVGVIENLYHTESIWHFSTLIQKSRLLKK